MLIKEVIVHEGLFDAPTTTSVANKPQAQPKPITASDMDVAEAKAKAEKLRKMAAIMQAKRLKAARTQLTADDLAMAFSLANS